MQIGYCRVSTKEQNLELQINALKREGCIEINIYHDIIFGMIKERPGLDAALKHLQEGDTFIVWKLDRLGYSLKDLLDLIEYFKKERIQFKSLLDDINTSTGRSFYNFIGTLAQMERELLIERTQERRLVAARKRGKLGVKKTVVTGPPARRRIS